MVAILPRITSNTLYFMIISRVWKEDYHGSGGLPHDKKSSEFYYPLVLPKVFKFKIKVTDFIPLKRE